MIVTLVNRMRIRPKRELIELLISVGVNLGEWRCLTIPLRKPKIIHVRNLQESEAVIRDY